MKFGKPRNGKPAFAVMERFDIPDFDRPLENYLTRWRLIETPWLSLYLHKIDKPDSRPTLHDHPWTFLALVLRGGYDEVRRDNHTMRAYLRTIKRFNLMRRDDAHYIAEIHDNKPCWTLLFVGRRRRTWGYWEQNIDPQTGRSLEPRLQATDSGWTWTEFNKHPYDELFSKALHDRAEAVESGRA